MFEKFLKRSSWTDIIISLVFVLLGILLVVYSIVSMSIIALSFRFVVPFFKENLPHFWAALLGAVFIIVAFLKLVDYFTSEPKEDYLLTMALIGIIIGVIVLLCPNIISNIFSVFLGVWIILEGLKDFQTTLVWKDIKSGYWTITLICSMLIIIAGIAVLVNTTLALKTIGIAIIVYAVLDIVARCIFMKKIKDYMRD